MQKLKAQRQTLENTSEKLISIALKAGATSAEVCASYSSKTKIGLEKQDFHMVSSDDGFQFGLKVLVGDKQGFASTNSEEPKELRELAEKAVQIAELSPSNPLQTIQPTSNLPEGAPQDLWDDTLFDLSLKTQKEWTKLIAEETMRDKRFRLNEGSTSVSASLFLIASSLGTHKLQKETALIWSLMGMAVDGEKITSFDYFQNLTRTSTKAGERMLKSAKSFREEVIANLTTGPAQSYKGLVVFSPRAALEVLFHPVTHHLNARNVNEGSTKWKKDTLQQTVLNESISLRDLPWSEERFGTSPFDREGTPTQNRSLIEKGKLQTFMNDHYSAKALEMAPSGNASGGPTSLPTVGAHVLQAGAGNTPKSALIEKTQMKQNSFLLVHRFSGQVDSVTGDFSGVAKGGEWWENGKRKYFVSETLISGNVFDCLTNALFGMSQETEVVESQDESPVVVCDGVSVTSN